MRTFPSPSWVTICCQATATPCRQLQSGQNCRSEIRWVRRNKKLQRHADANYHKHESQYWSSPRFLLPMRDRPSVKPADGYGASIRHLQNRKCIQRYRGDKLLQSDPTCSWLHPRPGLAFRLSLTQPVCVRYGRGLTSKISLARSINSF